MTTITLASHPLDPSTALLLALNAHDVHRQRGFAGVTEVDLDADKRLWQEVGEALAALARLIADCCGASAFNATRPGTSALCSRLAESIDDQVDGAAWALIEAAARAAVLR